MRIYLMLHAEVPKTAAEWTALLETVQAETVIASVFSYAVNASEYMQYGYMQNSGQDMIVDFDLPQPDLTIPLFEDGCDALNLEAVGPHAVVSYIETIAQNTWATVAVSHWSSGNLLDGIAWAHRGLLRGGPFQTARAARGNAAFNADALEVAVRYWYDCLQDGIMNSEITDYAPIAAAQSGDVYTIARSLGNDMLCMILAFRATGDLSLLTALDAWMWESYLTLELGDGYSIAYLRWYLWHDLEDPWYGHTGALDQNFADANALEYTYILGLNIDLMPELIDHYNAWLAFCLDHILPNYTHIVDEIGWPALIPEFTHLMAQALRFFYYAYKISGETIYLTRLRTHCQYWLNMVYTRPSGAYVWDHNCIELRYIHDPIRVNFLWDSMGVQETRYANFTVQAIIDLACEGVYPFCLQSYMAGLDATTRAIFANGLNNFSGTIGQNNVEPGEPFDPAQSIHDAYPRSYFDTVAWIATQAWRTESDILTLVEQERTTYTEEHHIMVPACMVFAYLFPLGR